MRAVSVVVCNEIGDDLFELATVPHDGAIEEFTAETADPTFSERIRDWGPDRSLEDLEAFGSEDLVEAVDELTVREVSVGICQWALVVGSGRRHGPSR